MAIGEILRNNVKEKLARDEVVASMTVRLVRTVEIARIARTAGFDTLYVDLEHSSFSLDACGQICIAALEAGIAPFVRVPANTPEYIARVLEGGALGVIAPHLRSADEALAVVRAAKFPPLGERSNASGLPHLHFRPFPVAEAYAATRPDLVAEFVKMGARYVSTGTDLAFLIGACTARANEVKKIKL
jgi:2-keto-3-deoxy-L-rhamnonate aldolase RhmA